MLDSKQRSNLISLSSNIAPIGQIGKNGITEQTITSFSSALACRELIKITVLESFSDTAKDASIELAQKLDAEVVKVIGRKIILYKYSDKEGVKHVALDKSQDGLRVRL